MLPPGLGVVKSPLTIELELSEVDMPEPVSVPKTDEPTPLPMVGMKPIGLTVIGRDTLGVDPEN